MNLGEFLLARIAEDEAANDQEVRDEVARCRADGMPDLSEEEVRAYWGDQAWWRRQIAECTAKRAVVELAAAAYREDWHSGYTCGAADGYGEILRLLALPYAGHADFRDEWRVYATM